MAGPSELLVSDDEDDTSFDRRVSSRSKVNYSKLNERQKIFRFKNMAKEIKSLKAKVRANKRKELMRKEKKQGSQKKNRQGIQKQSKVTQ